MPDRCVTGCPFGLFDLFGTAQSPEQAAQSAVLGGVGNRGESVAELAVARRLPIEDGLVGSVVGHGADVVGCANAARALTTGCAATAPVQSRYLSATPLRAHDHGGTA